MDDNSEELAFVVEDAKENIIVPSIEAVLKNQDFDQVKVDQWTDSICESIMKGLVDLQKPFKYIGQLFFSLSSTLLLCVCVFLLSSSLAPSSSTILSSSSSSSILTFFISFLALYIA